MAEGGREDDMPVADIGGDEIKALADRARAKAGPERDALFRQLVALQYANGEAINMAQTLEIDAVIDPADTRRWLVRGLASASVHPDAVSSYIDTW